MLTPPLILAFTFVIGSGVAFFAPVWEASVNELAPARDVPAAISLNSISFNVARSFGPAVGGLAISLAGVMAAFALNALFFLPMILVFLLWRRTEEESRFPPEQLYRAVIFGMRYVGNSPALRVVLVRALVMGVLGSILSSLMPLIARDQLGGDARFTACCRALMESEPFSAR
ncbi:hypothetical protein CVO77_13000 [Sphingopyxis lindanitolerans]|uniref:Major facilitator superfamily (MFS) profile domain-containing protein n=1 Tax=Sphingopyxis lindanitolerans TaxID=2054227 RepID=A0A2S8B0X7_9SPHN|nr:hypothetical protein CVO77_13000 [Sphingopyxis lindanitolerans]